MKTPERRAVAALFFLFGFGMISWVPRFPEIKANLHINNGQFGTLVSLGAIGSFLSFLTVGHLVHRFGTGKAMALSGAMYSSGVGLIVHSNHSWQFLLCNIAIGAGISAFHISVNSEIFHMQSKSEEVIMPRMHGAWSAGSLSTAILSGFLASRITLWIHIDGLIFIVYSLMLTLLWKMRHALLPGNATSDEQTSVKRLFKAFKVDWIITFSIIFSNLLELCIGDWATIFSKEDLHMSPGVSAIPFVVFASAMILGRFQVHRVTPHIAIADLSKWAAITCGIVFALTTTVGAHIAKSAPTTGFTIFVLGAFIGGLGSSFLNPTLLNAANKRSIEPGAVVLGRLGLLTTSLTFLFKTVIAWVAQLTSISVALLIPSLALISTTLAIKAIREASR